MIEVIALVVSLAALVVALLAYATSSAVLRSIHEPRPAKEEPARDPYPTF